MKFTARSRLSTYASVSRVQSDEETYDLERTVVDSLAAGVTADRCRQCGACDRSVDSVALGNREVSDMEVRGTQMTPEQTMMFKRLIEYAHRRAMMRDGQIAQDIRLALNDARRYWHLRDVSNPDTCKYYLASDDPASAFNNPAHVDKQIDADRANVEARNRATKA